MDGVGAEPNWWNSQVKARLAGVTTDFRKAQSKPLLRRVFPSLPGDDALQTVKRTPEATAEFEAQRSNDLLPVASGANLRALHETLLREALAQYGTWNEYQRADTLLVYTRLYDGYALGSLKNAANTKDVQDNFSPLRKAQLFSHCLTAVKGDASFFSFLFSPSFF